MKWLQARWAEPESRVAVAAILTSIAGIISGSMTVQTGVLAICGSILAFILPSTKPPH
jgi:hypothetical protein